MTRIETATCDRCGKTDRSARGEPTIDVVGIKFDGLDAFTDLCRACRDAVRRFAHQDEERVEWVIEEGSDD